jgi:hypothetical protein
MRLFVKFSKAWQKVNHKHDFSMYQKCDIYLYLFCYFVQYIHVFFLEVKKRYNKHLIFIRLMRLPTLAKNTYCSKYHL